MATLDRDGAVFVLDMGDTENRFNAESLHELRALLDIVRADDDVLGLEGLATHHARLDDAADLYRIFQEKQEECLKVVLRP